MAGISLSASRADGFYHPPDWDPSVVSRDKYAGSSGHNQYEEKGIVRFEMPYDMWCGGCKILIGKGTRYNSDKLKVGKYFSTTIWAFRCRCAQCGSQFIIQTDPKERDYVVIEGGEFKKRSDEASEDVEQLLDDDQKIKLVDDAFYKLEHDTANRAAAAVKAPAIGALIEHADRMADDYEASKLLRSRFRKDKKDTIARKAADVAERKRLGGIAIPLLAPSNQDKIQASKIQFDAAFKKNLQDRRKALATSSIFDTKYLKTKESEWRRVESRNTPGKFYWRNSRTGETTLRRPAAVKDQ